MSNEILDRKQHVPPFVSSSKIEPVFNAIHNFFNKVPNFKNADFLKIFKEPLQPTPLDQKAQAILTNAKNTNDYDSIITYFNQNRQYIPAGVKLISSASLVENYKTKYYYDYLGIAIESNNIHLLYEILFNLKQKTSLFHGKDLSAINDILKQTEYITPLFFDYTISSYYGIEHKLPRDILASSTSIACNESSVYIGTKNNTIVVFQSPGCHHHFQPYQINLEEIKMYKHYSLCLVENHLFVISPNQVADYNTETKKFQHISYRRQKDNPVCTDGKLMYAVSISTSKVHVYKFENGTFSQDRTIKLQFPQSQKSSVKEWEIPMFTNGTFMAILLPGVNQYIFHIFSLITGELLYLKSIQSVPEVQAVTVCPISGRTVVFTPAELTIFPSPHNMPKSHFNTKYPTNPDPKNFIDQLYLALYYGREMFFEGDPKYSLGILNKFVQDNNEKGINIALQILMRQDLSHNQDANALLCDFCKKQSSQDLKRAALSVFFCWIRNNNGKNKKKVPIPNICNDMFEEGQNLDMVYPFFDCINFSTFKLSMKAIENMIVYLSDKIDKYPMQSEHIIKPYLIKYVPKHFLRDYKQIINTLQKILANTKNILQKVTKSENLAQDFIETVHFRIWKVLIFILYSIKDKLVEHVPDFISYLNFLSIEGIPENPATFSIIQVIDDSLYLLLSLLFSGPHKRQSKLFKDIEEFYQEFEHPLSRKYPDVDNRLFEVLNNSYDVYDKKKFSEVLFSLRRYLVFENPGAKQRLKYRFENHSYSLKTCELFFMTGNSKNIFNVSGTKIIKEFVDSISRKSIVPFGFEVSFFGFLPEIKERIEEFTTDIERQKLAKFIQLFRWPYAFPPEILRSARIIIDAATLTNLPLEELVNKGFSMDDLPPINDPTLAIQALADDQPNMDFRNSLIWLYGCQITNESIFDKNLSEIFIRKILTSDIKTIEVLVNGLSYDNCDNEYSVFVFKNLLTILQKYCEGKQNIFIGIKELTNLTLCILYIVDCLRKQLLNEKSKFKELFFNFCNEKSDNFSTVCLILQNSIDIARKGVKTSIVMDSGELIKGEITLMDDNGEDITVLTKENNERKISLPNVRHCWCYPKTEIKPDLFDLDYFVQKFKTVKPSSEISEIWIAASFMFFASSEKFRSKCDEDLIKRFLTDDFSHFTLRNFIPQLLNSIPSYYNDDLPIFAFTETNDEGELPCDMKDGYISTHFLSATYISTPIYPFSAQRITMRVMSNDQIQSALGLRICGYSSEVDNRFEMTKIDVEMSNLMERKIVVEIHPNRSEITVDIDCGYETIRNCYSPSLDVIYFISHVSRFTVIEYHFEELEEEKYDVSYNFKQKIMNIETADYNVPSIESKLYNRKLFVDRKRLIINSIKQIITALFDIQLNPSQFFDVLRNVNHFPLEEVLDIHKMSLSELWLDSSDIFVKNVLSSMKNLDLEQVKEYILSKIKRISILDGNNRSAVLIPPNNPLFLSNTFVLSRDSSVPIKYLTVEKVGFKTANASISIPYDDVEGTIFDFLLLLRHCCFILKPEMIWSIKEKILEKIKPIPLFDLIFSKLLNLINILYPKVSEDNEIIPICNESFLLHNEETVKRLKQLLVLYFMNDGKTAKIDSKSVKIESKGKIVIGIKCPNEAEPNLKFQINDNNDKYEISPNSFIVIENANNPVVKTKSSMYDLSNYEVIYRVLPQNFDILLHDIEKWNVRHSQQLLQVFPTVFDKSVYQKIPLSTTFSVETAEFMFDLLGKIPKSNLYSISRHLTSSIQNTREEEGANTRFPTRIKGNNLERIDFLKVTKQTLFADDDYRTQLINNLPPQNFSIKRSIDNFAIMVDGTREQTAWMDRYLKSLKDYPFLIFAEFATGSFDLSKLKNKKICIRFVSQEKVIDAFPDDMLVNVGKFPNENEFINGFNKVLQKHDENTF